MFSNNKLVYTFSNDETNEEKDSICSEEYTKSKEKEPTLPTNNEFVEIDLNEHSVVDSSNLIYTFYSDEEKEPTLLDNEFVEIDINDHPVADASAEPSQAISRITPKKKSFFKSHELAIANLSEILVVMGYATATNFFRSPDSTLAENPFIISIPFLLPNVFSRTLSKINADDAGAMTRRLSKIAKIIRAICFANIDQVNRLILVHEGMGHALTAKMLFDSDPKVTVKPGFFSSSGVTQLNINNSSLTWLGEMIGYTNSLTVISAAGTGAEMLSGYISLILAELLPNKYHEIKYYLRATTVLSVITSVGYALSAYTTDCQKDKGHDFCKLKDADFSPISASVAMIGSMLFLQALLSFCSCAYRSGKEKKQRNRIKEIIEEGSINKNNLNRNSAHGIKNTNESTRHDNTPNHDDDNEIELMEIKKSTEDINATCNAEKTDVAEQITYSPTLFSPPLPRHKSEILACKSIKREP